MDKTPIFFFRFTAAAVFDDQNHSVVHLAKVVAANFRCANPHPTPYHSTTIAF